MLLPGQMQGGPPLLMGFGSPVMLAQSAAVPVIGLGSNLATATSDISFVSFRTADFTDSNGAVILAPPVLLPGDLILVRILTPFPLGVWTTHTDYVETRLCMAPDDLWWCVHATFMPYALTVGPTPEFTNAARQLHSIVFAKIALPTDLGASYTFRFDTTNNLTEQTTGTIDCVSYRGVDLSSPIVAMQVVPMQDPRLPIANNTGRTTLPMTLPIRNSRIVLLYSAHWDLTGVNVAGNIVPPVDVTEQYQRGQNINNAGAISLAESATNSGEVPAYTWTIDANPDSATHQLAHVICLRPASEPQSGAWAIQFEDWAGIGVSPTLFFQNDTPHNLYLANEQIDVNDDVVFAIRRFDTDTGLVEATFHLVEGAPDVSAAGAGVAINSIDADCPDNNLYYATTNRLRRLDTATLAQQAESVNFGDAPRAIRVGRKATWSESFIFITHAGLGVDTTDPTRVIVHVLDKLTLIEETRFFLGDFFTPSDLSTGPNDAVYDFGGMDTDLVGNMWIAVRFFTPAQYYTVWLFKIDAGFAITRFDVTSTFNPAHTQAPFSYGRIAIGLDTKTGRMLIAGENLFNTGLADTGGASSILATWNPAVGNIVTTGVPLFLHPSNTTQILSNVLAEIHPGFLADGAHSTSPATWAATEAFLAPQTFSALVEFTVPALQRRSILTMPVGFMMATAPVLDVAHVPNRLWMWLHRFIPSNLVAGAWEFANHPRSASTTLAYYAELDWNAQYTGPPCMPRSVPNLCLPGPITLSFGTTGTIILPVDGDDAPMPIPNDIIDDWVTGTNYTINQTVQNIPAGVTMTLVWLTIKEEKREPDSAARLQKRIISTLLPAGQITDVGTDGTGTFVFTSLPAETLGKFSERRPYYFDIKIKLSNGVTLLGKRGLVKFIEAITQSNV